MVLDSSMRVVQRLWCTSPFSVDDQIDSIIALLRASPTDLKDGMSPALLTFSVKTQEVKWTPWSACSMLPVCTVRWLIARSRALMTSWESWEVSTVYAIILRLQVSMMDQQCTFPWHVGCSVLSLTKSSFSRDRAKQRSTR